MNGMLYDENYLRQDRSADQHKRLEYLGSKMKRDLISPFYFKIKSLHNCIELMINEQLLCTSGYYCVYR